MATAGGPPTGARSPPSLSGCGPPVVVRLLAVAATENVVETWRTAPGTVRRTGSADGDARRAGGFCRRGTGRATSFRVTSGVFAGGRARSPPRSGRAGRGPCPGAGPPGDDVPQAVLRHRARPAALGTVGQTGQTGQRVRRDGPIGRSGSRRAAARRTRAGFRRNSTGSQSALSRESASTQHSATADSSRDRVRLSASTSARMPRGIGRFGEVWPKSTWARTGMSRCARTSSTTSRRPTGSPPPS